MYESDNPESAIRDRLPPELGPLNVSNHIIKLINNKNFCLSINRSNILLSANLNKTGLKESYILIEIKQLGSWTESSRKT